MTSFVVLVALFGSFNVQILVAAYFLTCSRPVLQSILFNLSMFVVYLLAGIGVVVGLGQIITNYLAKPHFAEYVLELLLGIVLFVCAFVMRHHNKDMVHEYSHHESVFKGLVLGGGFALACLPFSLPYYAVIAKILTARYPFESDIYYLILFNVVYLWPNLAILFLYLLFRERVNQFFKKYEMKIETGLLYVLKVVLLLLGVLLIADSSHYFVTGKPLWFALEGVVKSHYYA